MGARRRDPRTISVGLPWGGYFFCTHAKVNIRRKSQQHPKRDPIVKPRRLRLCGFPRFCSVSHGYTSQNFDCVPQQGALHSIVILSCGTPLRMTA